MFEKLPSCYRLTEGGEEVLELANQMEASSRLLETRVFGRDQGVGGLLRVTLTPPLATHLLMPDFADFARLYPDIEMEILSSGELANLTNREADVAIRVVYDRKTLPPNLHGLKGPELFGGVYISRDRCIHLFCFTGQFAVSGDTRTSPVKAFPPNGYGLFDVIGNVWERTTDWFSARHVTDASLPCCIPENPSGARESDSYDAHNASPRIPRKVVKGGSHLCAPNYCRRYRPAARHAQPIDTGMSHVGFRCIVRPSVTLT
jgi:hypothetical protein